MDLVGGVALLLLLISGHVSSIQFNTQAYLQLDHIQVQLESLKTIAHHGFGWKYCLTDKTETSPIPGRGRPFQNVILLL